MGRTHLLDEAGRGKSFHRTPKGILIIALAIGIFVRLLLMPILSYDFEAYHWALIVSNMQSGNGLYGLAGYYYTPIWGYIIGAVSAFQEAFLNISVFGARLTELLPIELLTFRFHTATITTPEFNTLMKIPLLLCDLMSTYLLFWIVRDRTSDEKKAAIAAALWFLCPTAIIMTGVQMQFDGISALIMMLTVFMLYKGKYFCAGFLFSTSVLLKFFPMFCLLVFIAYILSKHRSDGLVKRNVILAMAGAAIGLLLWTMPQIIDGTVIDSLSFMTNRMLEQDNLFTTVASNISSIVSFVAMLYFGYLMYRTKENHDAALFKYTFFTLAFLMLLNFAPQYPLVMIPFMLIYMTERGERRYLIPYALYSAAALIAVLCVYGGMLFVSSAAFTGIISMDWIFGGMVWSDATILGVTRSVIFQAIFVFLMLIGMAFNAVFCFENGLRKHSRRFDSFMARYDGKEGSG